MWWAPRRGRQRLLLGGADGGDDAGTGPPGQLYGGMADRSGAARDKHRSAGEGSGLQPRRPALRHRERAVCGDRRHPEARPHVETDGIGQRDH